MIAAGTLCLIVGDHGHAGRFCTVLYYWPTARAHSSCLARYRGRVGAYVIEVSGGYTSGIHGHPLGAFREQLMPVSPPSKSDSERNRQSADA